MPLIPIKDLAAIGVIKDIPDYELPSNAWTDARNIRFLDGSVCRARGHSSVITPAVAPYAIFPAPIPGALFWVYCGLTKVHAFLGAVDGDITRAASDYTATVNDQWQGGTFNGIFYLNNGVDDPQIWTPQATTTKLVKLTNWPASTKAKVLRHFRNYLIALDITKSSTRYPRLIKWSHSADVGTVPSSWDETDPALDAGEFALAEGFDLLVDCAQLGDLNIIYTESETWQMRYVGGTFVFNITNMFRNSGLLTQGCVAAFGGGHFVVSQDDVIVNNGATLSTRIDKRLRSWLFSRLSSSSFFTTRVVPHYSDREMWVCFSQGGGSSLDTALIWNWRDDTWTIRDLPDIRNAVFVPQALQGTTSTWDGLTGTWADWTGTWGDPERSPHTQSIMMASPSKTKILYVDNTSLFESTAFESYVEATGLTPVGVDQYGRIIYDPDYIKLLLAVYPKISAVAGTRVDIQVGARMVPTGSVSWSAALPYIVGTDYKVDTAGLASMYNNGRFLAIRFSSTADFRLQGYDLELAKLGLY
jgi:hypothetical protein